LVSVTGVLVFAGFYTSYFSVFLEAKPSIIHIHFTLMVLWIAMLITQPFLIKYKKLTIHRTLGKISYVLVPLVLISAFFMIRYSYYNLVDGLQQKAAQGRINLQWPRYYNRLLLTKPLLFFIFFGLLHFIPSLLSTGIRLPFMQDIWWHCINLLGPTVDRIVFLI
jgi:hypothetical protein